MTSVKILSAYDLLTDSERDFVEGYVRTVEAAADRANERVGHAMLRPIPADIVAQSRGLLEKPLILAAIQQRLQEISDDKDLTPRRIIRELMIVATANMADYVKFNEFGQAIDNLASASRAQMAAVKKIEIKHSQWGVQTTFQLHDKQAALDRLAQMMGIVDPDDNPHWQREKTLPQDLKALPASATPQQAERAYADLLESMRCVT